MSSRSLRQAACADFVDGAAPWDLQVLASLGSHGRHPGNLWRDLCSRLCANYLPEISIMTVPLKASASTPAASPLFSRRQYLRGMAMRAEYMHGRCRCRPGSPLAGPCDVSVLWPHEMFSAMYHCYKEGWQSLAPVGVDLADFWATMADACQLQGHPIWQREDRSLCVPLALHGDEVPVIATGTAHSRSLLVVSWRSSIGKKSAKLGNFVSALIWGHLVSKANACHTPAAFWRRLAWSLRALQSGVWPSTNSKGQPLHDLRAGQPLADGHCGILICIQADLAFHPSWLGLPAHNSLEPCQLCGVHRSKLLCRPFPRLFTADEWQARFAAKRSPLFSEVPGLSGLAVQPDLMRTKHLGTAIPAGIDP